MNAAIQVQRSTNNELKTILISTFLITQFLFFIDEGYYDFRWMANLGNWLVYLLYFIIVASGQLLMSWLISALAFKFNSTYLKTAAAIILGTVLSLWITFSFVFQSS